MTNLKAKIVRIGRQIVACNIKCRGIRCDQSAGVLPRCLILESAGHSSTNGCAAIGINPGWAKRTETECYKSHGAEYEAVVECWLSNIRSHAYYSKIRSFIDQVGLTGPILWSELAKCQNEPGAKGPPLKTLRTCTGRFLTRELKLIPRKWPLIGIGGEAYKALAYLYPNRTVIGLPHPTGAYGNHFSRHLPNGHIHPTTKASVRKALAARPGDLLWLGDVSTNPK